MFMVTSLLLVVQCISNIGTDANEIIGNIELNFFFETLDSKLPHGMSCDPWPFTKCDIYLTVCITSQGERACNLLYQQTPTQVDKRNGQATASFPLKKPPPKSIDVVVEAWDDDSTSSDDPIARFRGNFVVAELPNTPSPLRMVREEAKFINRAVLESYGHIKCSPFHYGGDCGRKCVPDPDRFACDMNGFKKCKLGFWGSDCDKVDYCLNHTCAAFAKCANTETGFECFCEGSSGPQCHRGYDPCSPEHKACSGHGVCTPIGPNRISASCTCEPEWEGPRCNIPRGACSVAIATNQTLCLNGGICRDLLSGDFVCDCPSGWWGDRCDQKTVVTFKTALMSTFIVGGCLILLAFLILTIRVCQKKRHRKSVPSFSYMSSAQLALSPRTKASVTIPRVESSGFPYMESGEPYYLMQQVPSAVNPNPLFNSPLPPGTPVFPLSRRFSGTSYASIETFKPSN